MQILQIVGNSILFHLSFEINALFLEQFPLRGCLNPDPHSYYVTYVSQEGSNEEVIAESKFYLFIWCILSEPPNLHFTDFEQNYTTEGTL